MGTEPMNQLTEPMGAPIVEPESWVPEMTGPKAPATAVDRMIELRSEVEARLLENDDYRTLVALDRAIAEISGATISPDPTVIKPQSGKRSKYADDPPVEVNGMSQADATHVLLTKVLYEPVPIARLVGALGAHGISVGGAQPNINLSSVLSKDGRFRSVRFKDRACWWVKGTPFPGELDAP